MKSVNGVPALASGSVASYSCSGAVAHGARKERRYIYGNNTT